MVTHAQFLVSVCDVTIDTHNNHPIDDKGHTNLEHFTFFSMAFQVNKLSD